MRFSPSNKYSQKIAFRTLPMKQKSFPFPILVVIFELRANTNGNVRKSSPIKSIDDKTNLKAHSATQNIPNHIAPFFVISHIFKV
jgi:hypothetical protein